LVRIVRLILLTESKAYAVEAKEIGIIVIYAIHPAMPGLVIIKSKD
jgi:hypothetical protein